MNELNKTFRDELLDVEELNATYKEKYEKEVLSMLEKKLSDLGRVGFALLAVVGLLAIIQFGNLAFSKFESSVMKFFVRIVTVPGIILALGWTCLTGWISIRGKFNLRTQLWCIPAIGVAVGFFFVAAMMFVFVVPITWENPVDWRSIFGTQLALMAFFFIVTVGLCLILRVLYRTEFKTREKLLEIEYRLAELAEKLEAKLDK